MQIFAGSRRDVNKGYWMSFENHPHLVETKRNIYVRCLPCLEELYVQLTNEPSELVLDNPLHCWKVVVVLDSLDQCLELLCLFEEETEEAKLGVEVIRGRIGTSDKSDPRVVIIFQMLEEKERDELMVVIGDLASRINPGHSLFYERGCGDLYGLLCGDWKAWRKTTPIIKPSLVPLVRDKVGRLLKGEY